MQEAFGAKPENIMAGIGPSIGQCCYEVDDKVYEAGKNIPDVLRQRKRQIHGRFTGLEPPCTLDAGLLPQNIYNAGVCTQCNKELFFSYRAENGETGRMGVTVWKSKRINYINGEYKTFRGSLYCYRKI